MITLNKKLLSKFKGKEFKIINLKKIIGEREISQLVEREKDSMNSVTEREKKMNIFFSSSPGFLYEIIAVFIISPRILKKTTNFQPTKNMVPNILEKMFWLSYASW